MVKCSICGIHVDYKNLRTEHPSCENGHALGSWVRCEKESHVFLRSDRGENCPYCDSGSFEKMISGMKVKCLHVTEDGTACPTRPFKWMTEGPPCFMNHVSKMTALE